MNMSYLASDSPSIIPVRDDTMLGYLAGIIDGEGTVIHNAGGGSGVQIGLRVSMTDKPVINWLKEHFGGVTNGHPARSNCKPAWAWTLQRQADLKLVLNAIEPLLICKRRQVQIMQQLLEHLAKKPNIGPGKNSERAARRVAREEWVAERQRLREAIRDAR